MKVALIQCPAWITGNPPCALALIGAALKNAGHEVRCFDLNVDFYHFIKNKTENRISISQQSWSNYHIETDWENEDNVWEFIDYYKKEFDESISAVIQSECEVICFSVQKTSALFSYAFTKKIRELLPGKIIIWGGPYCFKSFMAEGIIKNFREVDIVCLGDGESGLPELLHLYEKKDKQYLNMKGYAFRIPGGLPVFNDDQSVFSDLDSIPFSDYSLFDKTKYSWEFLPVIVSRGCINRCAFCNEYVNWDKYSFRSPEKVVDEIVFQSGLHPEIRFYWFTGSTISGHIKKLEEMCDLILEKNININWHSQLSFRKELSPDLLKKMGKSGCEYLHFGLESGNNHVLKRMNKGFDKSLAFRILKSTKKAGINYNLNLIVGFPGENNLRFIDTLLFVRHFLNTSTASSVADCHIIRNSILYREFSKYHVIDPDSAGWKTENETNTLTLRMKRVKYANQLYQLRMLNSYGYHFRNFNIFDRELIDLYKNKKLTFLVKIRKMIVRFYMMNDRSITKFIKRGGTVVIQKLYLYCGLSYLLFYVWLIYVFIALEFSRLVNARDDHVAYP